MRSRVAFGSRSEVLVQLVLTLPRPVVAARGGLRRESLEFREFMHMLHPAEPFGRLYLYCRRQRVGIVKRRGLHVDNARKHCGVPVEEAAPAVSAETAHRCP